MNNFEKFYTNYNRFFTTIFFVVKFRLKINQAYNSFFYKKSIFFEKIFLR